MEIIWHGHSCFTIKTKQGTAVINPYSSEIGLKLPSLKANVVLTSGNTPEYNNIQAIAGEPRHIDWPGEYEVSGIAITVQELQANPETSKSSEKTTFFMLDAEGLKICYLSDLKVPLNEEMLDSIGEVDVFIVPINGEKDAYKKAHTTIEELEPRVVIPMHYKTPGLKLDIEGLDNFAKQAGLNDIQPKEKLVLSAKSDLPQDKTDIVILEAQVG
jgi:L-ascorbate metabolism protein UlaG (beta-lactamase superfamily)